MPGGGVTLPETVNAGDAIAVTVPVIDCPTPLFVNLRTYLAGASPKFAMAK